MAVSTPDLMDQGSGALVANRPSWALVLRVSLSVEGRDNPFEGQTRVA